MSAAIYTPFSPEERAKRLQDKEEPAAEHLTTGFAISLAQTFDIEPDAVQTMMHDCKDGWEFERAVFAEIIKRGFDIDDNGRYRREDYDASPFHIVH